MVNSYENGRDDCNIGALTPSMGTDFHKLRVKIRVFVLYSCVYIGNQSGSQQGIFFPVFA